MRAAHWVNRLKGKLKAAPVLWEEVMLKLETRADLQRLVDEGLEETLSLEYKASPALVRESKAINELCKDVSAMANSAGGQIIYSIEEDKTSRTPLRIYAGVSDPKITRASVA